MASLAERLESEVDRSGDRHLSTGSKKQYRPLTGFGHSGRQWRNPIRQLSGHPAVDSARAFPWQLPRAERAHRRIAW
jgi:hypothetical protein